MVFQKTHGILDHDLVFESYKLNDLFGNPWTHHLKIDLAHVDFAVKLWGKLHRLEQAVLFVGKAPILLCRRALEESCIEIGRAHV